MNKNIVFVSVLLICAHSFAQAQSLNTVQSATVDSSCSISTTQNITFSAFNPLNFGVMASSGALQVQCTKGSYSVSRNIGENSDNFSKSVKRENTDGTLNGNVSTVSLVCSSYMKGPDGSFIEYRIGDRPSFTSMYRGTAGYTQADRRNCSTTDTVLQDTLTFNENSSQTVLITATIGNSQDKTEYKSLRGGTYIDTLTVSVTF